MAFGKSEGNDFFDSWDLWQKMTFVLACGIVGTIGIGLIKMTYDKYKLRKYTKIDKGKQTQTPEMLEAQPVAQANEEMKNEIPFGIRAIQSGIEVDGVWISRTNTPVGSSRASIMSEQHPRSFNNSALELPPPVAQAGSSQSSRAPSSFDRAVSAERLPVSNTESRSSSPGRGHAHNTHDGPRCSNCHHHVSSRSAALQTLDSPRSAQTSGPPSPRHPPPAQAQTGSSKHSSRRTSDESDYMAGGQDVRAYETAYFRPTSTQAPIDPRTDLELLRSHRLSHVAETGQLTPRVRKPGNSGEWASVADNQTSTINGVNYFVPQKSSSPPLQTVTDLSEEVGVASSSGPSHDGYAANQARQAVPLTESYAPNAPYYPDTYEPRGPQHQYSYDEVPYEVETEQNNQREQQILRKVNSGFEILRPGTFQAPTPEEVELAERRTSKKLQKKRRASDSSRKSAFVEQV